jgi:hypothetical protein
MVYAFDTLGYAKRLRDAGIPADHAEAHAEAAREFVMGELVTRYDLEASSVATRRDIDLLRRDVEAAIVALRHYVNAEIASLRNHVDTQIAALRHDMERLELRLTVRFGGMLAVGVAILAAIIKL